MVNRFQYAPINLNENEQVVLAVEGRTLPSLSDAIFVVIFAPALFLLPLLVLHRFFRPVSYLITTQRILVAEPEGQRDSLSLREISKIRGTRTSLMIYTTKHRMWLSRLPDAWYFENVINNLIEKIET